MRRWWRLGGRMALLVVVAAGVGLVWNAVSPWGIPLCGQWNAEVGVVTPSPSAQDDDATLQTVEAARRLWEKGVVFLDARHVESYMESHIQGAVSMPVYNFESLFFDFLDAYTPDTAFVVYCSGRLCDESHRLATMLNQEGYMSVRIFADGMPAWVKAGLPVEGGAQ